MPRIAYSDLGATPYKRLLGHNPNILRNWEALESAFYQSETFESDLKEQVRRTLAHGNGCEYCMAGGEPACAQLDRRTALAVGFAERVLRDHRTVEDSVFAALREVYNDAELAELCAFVAVIGGSQVFSRLLALEAPSAPAAT